MSNTITLAPFTPGNLAGAETLITRRDELVAASQQFRTIDNQTTFQAATDALAEITRVSNRLEDHRKTIAKPYADVASAIKAAADDLRKPLEAEKARLRTILGEYVLAQQRKADEERRAREQAEQEAAEKAVQQHQELVDAGLLEQDTPVKIEQPVAPVPVVAAPHAFGAKIGTKITYTITDDGLVDPHLFKSIDTVKINAYVRLNGERIKKAIQDAGGVPVEFTPGIKFAIETTVSSTGR